MRYGWFPGVCLRMAQGETAGGALDRDLAKIIRLARISDWSLWKSPRRLGFDEPCIYMA